MGRPPKWKDIPAEQVQALAQLGCTIKEMADFFGVHPDTISNHFSAEITKGQTSLKIKLRRLQMKAAEGGNVTMMIFLGKNLLGQSGRVTYQTAEELPKTLRLTRVVGDGPVKVGTNGDCR